MLPVLLRRGPGHLRLWQAVIIAIVVGPGFALPAFAVYQFAPASHGAAILAGALPLFTVPIAWLALGEHLNIRRLFGLLALFAGIVFLLRDSFSGFAEGQWRGDLLFVAGAIDWSIFAFLPSKFATAPLIDIAGQAFYQGFLSMIVSLLLFTRAVAALGASLTTMITAFVPVTAALSALVILGEPLTLLTIAAIILVTIGMFGAVSERRARKAGERPAPAGEKAA